MGLSVHQISPKPLQVDSWNSHIVHVFPRRWSNSFQNQFYCPFFINFSKKNSANRRWPETQIIAADPKRKLSPPFDSADYVPSLGHPAPGLGKMLSLFTVLCDYSVWWPRPEPRVRVKRFSQSEFCSTTAAVARTTFRLDRFRNHSRSASHALNASLPYTLFLHGVNVKC